MSQSIRIKATELFKLLASGQRDFSGYMIEGPFLRRHFSAPIAVTVIEPVDLRDLNFSGARFVGAFDVRFIDCDLTNADLSQAKFPSEPPRVANQNRPPLAERLRRLLVSEVEEPRVTPLDLGRAFKLMVDPDARPINVVYKAVSQFLEIILPGSKPALTSVVPAHEPPAITPQDPSISPEIIAQANALRAILERAQHATPKHSHLDSLLMSGGGRSR